MTEHDLPTVTQGDITPAIHDLSRLLIGLADTGTLTLDLIERALVAHARSLKP